MKAEIKFSEKYSIYSDMYDYSVTLEEDDKNYSLITETVNIVNEYLQLKGIHIKSFNMKITGKMEKNGRKYGIGSSGSVTVLTVKAMSKLYSYDISEEELFKLSSYVLLKRGDNGSMGDIACISYENLIFYKSFDRKKISELMKNETLESVLKTNWNYEISELQFNKNNLNCNFLVGWTKEPAISSNLINIVKSSIDENFLKNIENIVQDLKIAIKNGDKPMIKKCINENGKLLQNLNENIYSKKLVKLVNSAQKLDICAKSSGAGGGDCGIALSFNKNDTKTIIDRWEKFGIELLYVEKL